MKTNKRANFKLSLKKNTIASFKEQELIKGGIIDPRTNQTVAHSNCKMSCKIVCHNPTF